MRLCRRTPPERAKAALCAGAVYLLCASIGRAGAETPPPAVPIPTAAPLVKGDLPTLEGIKKACLNLPGLAAEKCLFDQGFDKLGDDFCERFRASGLADCGVDSGLPDAIECARKFDREVMLVCLTRQAFLRKDEAFCDRLAPYVPEIAQRGREIGMCAKVVRDAVAFEQAKNASTVAECQSLGISSDLCILRVAVRGQDPTTCAQARAEHARISCYQAVAEVTRDKSICDHITRPGAHKSWCLMAVAKASQDETICRTLDEYHQENCLLDVALAARREELCPATQQPMCKAVIRKDYELCDMEECLYSVAVRNNDVAGCQHVAEADGMIGREQCIVEVASNLRDSSICAKAGGNEGRCRERVRILGEE